jgi:hypothetical protein
MENFASLAAFFQLFSVLLFASTLIMKVCAKNYKICDRIGAAVLGTDAMKYREKRENLWRKLVALPRGKSLTAFHSPSAGKSHALTEIRVRSWNWPGSWKMSIRSDR